MMIYILIYCLSNKYILTIKILVVQHILNPFIITTNISFNKLARCHHHHHCILTLILSFPLFAGLRTHHEKHQNLQNVLQRASILPISHLKNHWCPVPRPKSPPSSLKTPQPTTTTSQTSTTNTENNITDLLSAVEYYYYYYYYNNNWETS